MKKFSKVIAITIAMILVISCFASCGNNEDTQKGTDKSDTNSKTKDSGSNDMIEVSVAIWGAEDALTNRDNDPIYKILAEKTGVKLVPKNVTWDDFEQKVQLWATNGQLPDLFVGDYVGKSFFYNWVNQDVIKSLPDNLDEYPNLKSYLTNSERAMSAKYNDKFYMIPRQTYKDITYSVQDRNIAYRWDLAKAAGVEKEPETYDEFRDMIQKIIKADPEGKQIAGMTTIQSAMVSGIIYPYGGILEKKWVEKDGKFMPSYFAGDLKSAMQLARDMYNEGTIEKDIAQAKFDITKEKFLQGKNAAVIFAGAGPAWLYSSFAKDYEDLYGRKLIDDIKIAKLYPCVDGKKYYFVDTEAWSETYISSNVDDKKLSAICKLFDFLYSEEGQRLMVAGIDGEDYDMVDGKIVMKEGVDIHEKYDFFNVNSSVNALGMWSPESWNLAIPSATPMEYRELNTARHEDALNNGTLPVYYDDVLFLSTPLKDEFVMNTSDDLLQIMVGDKPVDQMVDELMASYEEKGLSKMIDEVNEAAKKAGIQKK